MHRRSPFGTITLHNGLRFRSIAAAGAGLALTGCGGDLSALDPAGPSAAAIADLWWLMLCGGAAIFLLVLGLFLLLLFKPGSGRRIAPSRWIWAGGVAFPLVTLVALVGYGMVRGEDILNLQGGGAPVAIEARGTMWRWEFRYDGGARASRDVLHIPAGRTVVVTATSDDVIHSFWVPRLGGKIDAIPGHATTLRILAERPGVYGGICSEYCGTGHGAMLFTVEAHAPDVYEAVLAGLDNDGEQSR
ncbi:cytochrome c oxidase subunit II [Ensifer soli]|uniref:cytochrome c oxidase subunit II n=1 Tax=Ciceribacter sp. sgz301302 TaxID=3342379 RepID=UPI0035B9ED18